MDRLNRNLVSARNVASHASRQYRCLHNHAVLSHLCQVEFRFRSFISVCLFAAGIQYCPGPSPPLRYRRRPRPRPGGQSAPALPRRWRRPRPASGAAGAGHVPADSASVLAAAAAGASRGLRSLSSPLWTSSSPRPSPQVVPAAATSASALQESKSYSGEAAESMSNNAQCCDMENESVPLQRENR